MDEQEIVRWLDALAHQNLIHEWHWTSHTEPGRPVTICYLIDGRRYTHEGAVRLLRDFEAARVP